MQDGKRVPFPPMVTKSGVCHDPDGVELKLPDPYRAEVADLRARIERLERLYATHDVPAGFERELPPLGGQTND